MIELLFVLFVFVFRSFLFLLFSEYEELTEYIICNGYKHCGNKDFYEPVMYGIGLIRKDSHFRAKCIEPSADYHASEPAVYEAPHNYKIQNQGAES